MRRCGVLILIGIVLGSLVLPGVLGASSGMYESQIKEYTVHDDGSANVTFNITFYGPPSYLNSTRAEIAKVGIKNYTDAYVSQLMKKLEEAGYSVTNMSAKIIGYNSKNGSAPITVIVRADLGNFAHYFSWGNVWEIRPDPLMIRDILGLNVSALNVSATFNNTFIYHLPSWAKVLKTPGSYIMVANGSIVNMTSRVINETVYVHSYIHFKKGITESEFRYLYSKPRLFLIEYTGKAGPENYSTWASSTYENFTVRKDGSAIISIEEVYTGRWADYVRSRLAMSLSVYGVNATERMLAYYRAKGLEEQGLKIVNFSARIYGMNTTEGPVKIYYEFVTAPSSSSRYVIQYRPKMGFSSFTFPDKALIAINRSEILRVTIPKGWTFTEVPNSTTESVNGTVIRLSVEKVDNTLKLESYFYMRYGTPNQTLSEMMSRVPTVVTIGYEGKPEAMGSSSLSSSTQPVTSTASSSSSKKICGPASLVALAIIPLLLRRRR